MKRMGKRAGLGGLGLAALALLVAYLGSPHVSELETSRKVAPGEAHRQITSAIAERRSGIMVEVEGTVVRLLSDDLDGSRHQRFIVEILGGHTLLVAHNIDLAPRVPLAEGETVQLRGQYEWNDRGGVVHWTHHDPDSRRAGGWIKHAGRSYK